MCRHPGRGEGRRKLEERGLHCPGAGGEDNTSPGAKRAKKKTPSVTTRSGNGGREPGEQRGSPPASCQAQSCRAPTPTLGQSQPAGQRGCRTKATPSQDSSWGDAWTLVCTPDALAGGPGPGSPGAHSSLQRLRGADECVTSLSLAETRDVCPLALSRDLGPQLALHTRRSRETQTRPAAPLRTSTRREALADAPRRDSLLGSQDPPYCPPGSSPSAPGNSPGTPTHPAGMCSWS